MLNIPNIPQQLGSAQVLTRIILRLILIGVFAALGSQGFAKTLSALLVMAAVYCAFIAALRREAVFGGVLTNWDEAAIYLLIGRVAASLA
jgi:hypothetical protein